MTKKYLLLQTATLSLLGLTVTQAAAQDVAAVPQAHDDGEIIVTAGRRAELVNDVPVAITALSGSDLKHRQISDGSDLDRAVPNMSFTRASFGSTNYSIRGVGYQVVSTTADTGVGVDENNAPLAVNRLADAEFFDVQRIEVLRGPQGTLYGRNATGGVIDVITNKPVDTFEASIGAGYGNYDSRKLQGMINLPLGSVFSLRVAGSGLKRDGFQQNSVTGNDIDSRNLYSTRATLAFTPSPTFHAFAMWEHFNEDDSRFGGQKFLCSKDVGPASVGGVAVNSLTARNLLSRGCLKDSIHSKSAQSGTVNTMATLPGSLAFLYGLVSGDVNGADQSGDQRTLSQNIDPTYKARNDLFQLNMQWDVTPSLQLTSLTAYSHDKLDTRAEFQSASIPFNNTVVTPGGVFVDPQTGTSRFLNLDTDYDIYRTKQWSQEVRLQSSFSGPLNFNLGAFYMHLNRFNNIFILSNGETAATAIRNLLGGSAYIDPNPKPNSLGHNYFNAYNPYTLNSRAAFGELYWQASDTVRVTAGLRYTSDHKDYTNYPITILTNGIGFPDTLVEQRAKFGELTGRANVDWRPVLSFTDKTLVYASFSRGYKAGGFNPPNVVEVPPIYAPEFVDSFEIGTKNTLFNDHATLNLTAFHYDYKGYQISQVQGLNEATANVDAKIYGVEIETTWAPTEHLRFNAQAGYLHSSIGKGSSVDTYDRIQGDPSLIYLKSLTSACVAAVTDVAKLVALINAGKVPATALTGACPTDAAPNGAYASSDPSKNSLAALGVILPTSTGVPVNLKGKRLPNAPSFTATLGAQYALDLGHDWQAVARGEVYHQSSFYTDIYNNEDNRLKGWNTVNLSVSFNLRDTDLQVQAYVKNAFDKTVVTGIGVNSETLGVSRSVVLLDPRLFGLSISKRF